LSLAIVALLAKHPMGAIAEPKEKTRYNYDDTYGINLIQCHLIEKGNAYRGHNLSLYFAQFLTISGKL